MQCTDCTPTPPGVSPPSQSSHRPSSISTGIKWTDRVRTRRLEGERTQNGLLELYMLYCVKTVVVSLHLESTCSENTLPCPYLSLNTALLTLSPPSTHRAMHSATSPPSTRGGVETNLITVAPAAPSLDLLARWETQHLESGFSVQSLLGLPDWGDDVPGGYVDRVVSLSLSPGESRVEHVLAVLQPLLTGVAGIGSSSGVGGVGSVGGISTERDRNGQAIGEEPSLEIFCDVDDARDYTIAEDMRITLHQWARPPPSSSSSSSAPSVQPPLSACDTAAVPGSDLVKTSSLQRDFSGPLKSDVAKIKQNNLSGMTCKLLSLAQQSAHSHQHQHQEREQGNLSSLPSSLSLLLALEFEYSQSVVAFRLDVETLARNSGDNHSESDEHSLLDSGCAAEARSPLYLRRYARSCCSVSNVLKGRSQNMASLDHYPIQLCPVLSDPITSCPVLYYHVISFHNPSLLVLHLCVLYHIVYHPVVPNPYPCPPAVQVIAVRTYTAQPICGSAL